MKRVIAICLCLLLLSGCGAEETFETVADELMEPVLAEPRQMIVSLPEEAAAPAIQSDGGELYQCDGYEIMLQTMAGGDLDATVRSISGYSRENVVVMETVSDGIIRYDLVWACAGETGDRIGRATILDDGSYHYALSALGDADRKAEYGDVWDILFASLTLS